MVAASDNLLSPKGVNYEGMCQVGSSSKDTKPMSFCFVVFFFYFFLLTESLFNSVFFLGEAVPALMAVKIKLKDELNVMNG